MCILGKSFSSYGVGVQTENKDIAIRYAFLIKNIAILNAMLRLRRAAKANTVMINDKAQCEKVLAFFGHESKGSLKINHSNFDCENCQKSFLAGAFLSCGTASDPNKDYHLEFTVAFLNLSKSCYSFGRN